jgi:hypothetical protein
MVISNITWRPAVSEYLLGSEIQYQDKAWRVVRILSNDQTLFEDLSGAAYTILESFIMIKDAEGNLDFIVMNSEKLPYTGPSSTIKALAVIPWRQNV